MAPIKKPASKGRLKAEQGAFVRLLQGTRARIALFGVWRRGAL